METMADKRIFIDTNILIYSSFKQSPFHSKAVNALAQKENEGFDFFLSRQIIREYLVVKSRFLKENNSYIPSNLTSEIAIFEKQFTVLEDNFNTTQKLCSLIDQFTVSGKQVHDCNIVASMLVNNVSNLLTHNIADFTRYKNEISIISL